MGRALVPGAALGNERGRRRTFSLRMVAVAAGLGVALVSLAGCGAPGRRQPEPEFGGRGPAAAEAATADTSSPVAAGAGTLADRGEGAATFVFECGRGTPGSATGEATDSLAFVARIEGETAWLFLPGQTVSLPHVEAASGTKYTDGEVLFWQKVDEARLEWQGRTYAGCRNNRPAAVWEHAKLNGADFRAVGQEPGWHLEIRRADTVVLVSDYGTARHTFPWAEPVGEPRVPRTTYWLQSGAEELRVVVEPGPCSDTMSGEQFETRVTLWLNGQKLQGCGRALH